MRQRAGLRVCPARTRRVRAGRPSPPLADKTPPRCMCQGGARLKRAGSGIRPRPGEEGVSALKQLNRRVGHSGGGGIIRDGRLAGRGGLQQVGTFTQGSEPDGRNRAENARRQQIADRYQGCEPLACTSMVAIMGVRPEAKMPENWYTNEMLE